MSETSKKSEIFTIGHSTHEFERFVALLKRHAVDAVADVRSTPYSRWQPQFNREELSDALKKHGISYVFLGKELGARSDDPECYDEGRVQYRRLAETKLFRSGIERVLDGARRMRIALMCAEKDPLECHRTILVARELVNLGSEVQHILSNGDVESHEASLRRLFNEIGSPEHDLFLTEQELVEQAYDAQEKRIAYVDEERARVAQEAGK
jgi:uncharacterized protein (DUF488 family)